MSASHTDSISLESEQLSVGAFQSSSKLGLDGKDPKTTFITNVNQLEKEHPKIHKSFLESMAREICRELHKHAKRMKAIMRKQQH